MPLDRRQIMMFCLRLIQPRKESRKRSTVKQPTISRTVSCASMELYDLYIGSCCLFVDL